MKHILADDNLLCDIAVSFDCTVQKRFSSLLGACKYHVQEMPNLHVGTDAYEKFINGIPDSHECSTNQEGSAGLMQAEGG